MKKQHFSSNLERKVIFGRFFHPKVLIVKAWEPQLSMQTRRGTAIANLHIRFLIPLSRNRYMVQIHN